jgi:hypothetical protein
MHAIRSLALAAALSLGAALPAPAMTVADLAGAKTTAIAPVNFLLAEQLGAGPRRADARAAAAEDYFNFDAIITLGALALAGGGLAAFGAYAARRKRAREDECAEPDWQDSVFRSMQADLAHFTETLRRAA